MRILLLSAYDAESHVYWRKSLVEHLPEHEWTVLSLPGRYFSWRMRGNSLSWAFSNREVLEQPYDLIVATSMTDLSALKGFVPSLACTPTLVYFHENQFAYPQSGKEFKSVEPCILNLYTALAADYCLFNSEYNRRTLLDGATRLLKKLPDHVPDGLIDKIRMQSQVLPVPLKTDSFLDRSTISVDGNRLNIVWNHRWEFDKNPQLLLDAITQLKELTDQFRVHVVGQQFRQIPEAFIKLKTLLGNHCGEWGYMESRAAYQKLLHSSDVVLSTALHDYQGIAVLEGAAAGAYPIVPDRLAYQELFPVECRYTGEPESKILANKLYDLTLVKQQQGELPSVDVQHLSWAALADQYRDVIMQVAKPA
ncbi:DUF3524 domain-containing protein [uncultured Neptuniibacter sp.]|uniref:tRNA-queuosine alpha-mannosyltransferase domain-containing protein n=1 Tax=uncultured Neptuniibacter sp. TaxID=502143 RepID=UPI0026270B64|nr:DUF3524 domain-containing protein [uncultured Neptuniibacter sp.]